MSVVNIGGGASLSAVKKVHEFVAHATNVNCATLGPLTGQVLATGGDDKKVNVWRVGSSRPGASVNRESAPGSHGVGHAPRETPSATRV